MYQMYDVFIFSVGLTIYTGNCFPIHASNTQLYTQLECYCLLYICALLDSKSRSFMKILVNTLRIRNQF